MNAYFCGHAFSPHKHDTYAIGMTTVGVQSFDYRGSKRCCLPGQVFVLHPDERHDGYAGDDRGFGYGIAYIDPVLICDVSEATALPFLRDPISDDQRMIRAVKALVTSPSDPEDELGTTSKLVALADALIVAAGISVCARRSETNAAKRVCDLLQSKLHEKISASELESVSGLSRWQLTRQFRNAFGVSPYRYHLMRRLDRARALLSTGGDLADVAQSTGFADQAHLTRHFRSAYGLSPGQWRRLSSQRRA